MRYSTLLLTTLLITATPTPTQPQAPNASPTFEVASIRPEESGGTSHYVQIGFEQDGYTATGATLQLLLQEAYGIDDDRQIIGAPAWVGTQSYTIEARIDDATAEELSKLSDNQRNLAQQHMLQTLLTDRFNLKLHRETKELPIYSLVIAKNGPKLHEPKPGETYANGTQWPGGASMGPDTVSCLFLYGKVQMKGQGASIARLVDRLTQQAESLQLDRKIVDNTGLTGHYDFELDFKVPWQTNAGEDPEIHTDDPALEKTVHEMQGTNKDSYEMSLFTALQEQLGLKLEPTKGLVETLIIDHVEKPSEN